MTSQTEIPAPPAVESDLQRLSELATLVTAAQDAMSDEIVTRLASACSEGITLLDRLTRNKGLMYFLQQLDRPENQRLLINLSKALTATAKDMESTEPAKGGVIGLYKLANSQGTQEGLRLVSLLGAHLSESNTNSRGN